MGGVAGVVVAGVVVVVSSVVVVVVGAVTVVLVENSPVALFWSVARTRNPKTPTDDGVPVSVTVTSKGVVSILVQLATKFNSGAPKMSTELRGEDRLKFTM